MKDTRTELNSDTQTEQYASDAKINIAGVWRYMCKRWWWFLISVVIFLSIGILFMKIKHPNFTTYATVMFNQGEDENANGGGLLGSLISSFSVGGTSYVNIDDEIIKIQSHSAIKRMVNELRLNPSYTGKKGLFEKKILYFGNSPIEIQTAPGLLDTVQVSTSFKIKIKDKGKRFDITVKQSGETIYDKTVSRLPVGIKTPYGTYTIVKTSYFRPQDITIKAVAMNNDEFASNIFAYIDCYANSKKANAVTVKIDGANIKQNCAMAQTLIDLYNLKSIETRSAQGRATLEFLNARLHKLYSELESSETGIADYKKRNNIVDPEAEATYIFKLKQQADGGLIELESQLGILRMLRDFLSADTNQYSLIPFTGVSAEGSETINNAINSYNELVLKLITIQSNAKGSNAALRQIENQVKAMRANMLTTIERSIQATEISLRRMNQADGTISSRITSMPGMEKDLTNLYRDREIKNRIYAYLLQKREEAELRVARTLPTGMIIDEPYTDPESETPTTKGVLAVMFIVGILVPALVLSIRSRKRTYRAALPQAREEEETFEDEL